MTTTATRTSSTSIPRVCLALGLLLLLGLNAHAAGKLKALIVDGQNNHTVWPKSTIMMKQYLEETGMFEVDVARTHYIWKWEREKDYLPLAGVGESEGLGQPKADPDFNPDFKKYDVVVSNFGWKAADWPEKARRAFEDYMKNGGGLVAVHAADNSWPTWPEFNKMIGLGGWGDRSAKDGPYVYYNNDGQIVRDPSPGKCGQHAPAHEFVVTIRNHDHPITKGLPDFWMHSKDECYSHLRGPAENMTILATACDSPQLQAAGRHEPMLMTIKYHQGRVFHTTLGHDDYSFESVGFITTFLRGTEWAATGKVTLQVPDDFPGAAKPSVRPWKLKESGWTEVFNGKDLKGWSRKGGQAKYEVENGVLLGTSQPNTQNTFLCPAQQYGDFELTFEVKCDAELNSGVQIRSIDNPARVPAGLSEADRKRALGRVSTGSLCGPQVEIAANGNAGGVYFEGVGGWLLSPKPAVTNPVYQRDGWNAYRVVAKGPRIQVWINGTKISDDDETRTHMRKGYLGFQVHAVGKRTEPLQVRWRNIRIREL